VQFHLLEQQLDGLKRVPLQPERRLEYLEEPREQEVAKYLVLHAQGELLQQELVFVGGDTDVAVVGPPVVEVGLYALGEFGADRLIMIKLLESGHEET